MSKSLTGRIGVRLLPILLLSACQFADARMESALETVGLGREAPASPGPEQDLFHRIGAQPANGQLHFENGRFLLRRGLHGDLQLARVAFVNASRLQPDSWKPEVGLAAVEYRLGNYDAAVLALVAAVERRDDCSGLCYGLALAAFRAGCFDLAAGAWAAARRAGPPTLPAERKAAEFLALAFADGPGSRAASQVRSRVRPPRAAPTPADPANVAIDAYIIRRTRDSGSSVGINLLEALKLQFGSTLVNLNHTKESGSPGRQTLTRSLEVNIPSVVYALNVASEDRSGFSLEASPSVVGRAGKTSRFFDGANITIVPQGDFSENIERDIGIDLKVTPNEVGADAVEVTASMELSNITGRSGDSGTQILSTDKTVAEGSASIPFGRAMALGASASTVMRTGDAGVPALREVPGMGRLFGTSMASVRRADVLALVAVRRPEIEGNEPPLDEAAISQRLFGKPPGPVERIARLPYQAPSMEADEWL